MRESVERNETIAGRHEGGESYASLARAYGISPERVRQIVDRMTRRNGLSTRAIYSMMRLWAWKTHGKAIWDIPVGDRPTASDLLQWAAGVSDRDLLWQRNIGRVTLAEIRAADPTAATVQRRLAMYVGDAAA